MNSERKSSSLSLAVTLVAAVCSMPAPTTAQSAVGVIVDRGRASSNPIEQRQPYAHVFDPDTLQIRASVPLPLPPFAFVADVEIAPDLSEAYIGNNDLDQVWVIDLHSNPPSLAAGVNPIQMVGGAEDLALSRDGAWLVAGSGNGLSTGGTSLAVVDVRRRVQTSERSFRPYSPIAVDIAPDGTVLVAELTASTANSASTTIRRYKIDGTGTLVDTGQASQPGAIPGAQNLIVPSYPSLPRFLDTLLSRHVVHVSRPAGMTVGALRLDGLEVADAVTLAYPSGIDLCFDPWRSIVYVRSNELAVSGGAGVGNSRIDGYFFSPLTGRFGPSIVSVQLERRAGTAFGVEQTAVDPVTRRLFVSGLAGGEVRVFDSLTGQQEASITHPDLLWAFGVGVRRR